MLEHGRIVAHVAHKATNVLVTYASFLQNNVIDVHECCSVEDIAYFAIGIKAPLPILTQRGKNLDVSCEIFVLDVIPYIACDSLGMRYMLIASRNMRCPGKLMVLTGSCP